MADDDQVVAVCFGVGGDDLGRVPGDEIGVYLDPSLLGLCFGALKDALEVRVLLVLDLVNFTDRASVGGEPALHRERGQPRATA